MRENGSRTRVGKLDPETRAAVGGGVHAALAAHAGDGLAHEGKADPGAGIVGGRVEAFEELENTFVMAGIDADAVVLHPETDAGFALLAADADGGEFAGAGELERVRHEV